MRDNMPRAKKSLGQNFLQDANIARKIVGCLDIEPGDRVLEIGPGPGALTCILQESPAGLLVLVEKDGHYARERMAALRRRMQEQKAAGGCGPHGAVILADALTLPWGAFGTPWKFVGNLPYNVASPLMWELFSRARGLARAVFMVQKEVGQRLAARPGSGAYGALSVWVQSFVRPKLEFVVPPQVFVPRPKVDSAVLSFVPVKNLWPAAEPAALARVLKACFQMRRKQLGTIVRSTGGHVESLDILGVPRASRPEDLSVETFHQLARAGIFLGKH